jgi:hypothetical protein
MVISTVTRWFPIAPSFHKCHSCDMAEGAGAMLGMSRTPVCRAEHIVEMMRRCLKAVVQFARPYLGWGSPDHE